MDDKDNSLFDEGFGAAPVANGLFSPDPQVAMEITLTLDQISTYDKNPRHAENDKFLEIKESIQTSGLHQQLVVTKRPGTDIFIIRRGGNTRLRCLKELWQETQDEKFYRLQCRFEPWTSDSDLIGAHMAENEQRGDMIFIDKALAAHALKLELESSLDRELSQRELIAEIKKTGWIINTAQISQYLYAAEVLYPLVPIALNNGMGRPAIQVIKKTADAFEQFAQAKLTSLLSASKAKDLWYFTLQEMDSITLIGSNAISTVEQVVTKKIASLLELNENSVSIEIDALKNSTQAIHLIPTLAEQQAKEIEKRLQQSTPNTVSDSSNQSDITKTGAGLPRISTTATATQDPIISTALTPPVEANQSVHTPPQINASSHHNPNTVPAPSTANTETEPAVPERAHFNTVVVRPGDVTRNYDVILKSIHDALIALMDLDEGFYRPIRCMPLPGIFFITFNSHKLDALLSEKGQPWPAEITPALAMLRAEQIVLESFRGYIQLHKRNGTLSAISDCKLAIYDIQKEALSIDKLLSYLEGSPNPFYDAYIEGIAERHFFANWSSQSLELLKADTDLSEGDHYLIKFAEIYRLIGKISVLNHRYMELIFYDQREIERHKLKRES